ATTMSRRVVTGLAGASLMVRLCPSQRPDQQGRPLHQRDNVEQRHQRRERQRDRNRAGTPAAQLLRGQDDEIGVLGHDASRPSPRSISSTANSRKRYSTEKANSRLAAASPAGPRSRQTRKASAIMTAP